MNWYQRTIHEEVRAHGTEILRISEVSSIIGSILDDSRLQEIWVKGEVTNFKPHMSGHRYFSLSERNEDAVAVIQCVMWRSDVQKLSFEPKDGMGVIAFGSVGHYAPQGRYQFYIKDLRRAGEGEKHLMVERWKAELAAEGHFLPEKKKELPRFPGRVGVVTSETGAVLQDIKNIISRRFPVELVVSPTAVQGDEAAAEIVQALGRIDGNVDVIILGRGGGSFEDLFPFNHPEVVRAIARCVTPVVSAIGHEVDFTLADLAADVRAPTPSAAAELVVPDRAVLVEGVRMTHRQLGTALINRLERAARELQDLRERFAIRRMERRILEKRQDSALAAERLNKVLQTRFGRERLIIEGLRAALTGRNPLAVLGSGYCIVEKAGKVIRRSTEVCRGDCLLIRMTDGKIEVLVRDVHHDKKI